MADTYKLPAADYGAGPGEFVRGFRSSLLSNKVGGQASDWFKAKQAGDVEGMLAAEVEIERLRQEQAKVAPTVTDVRQVHGLGDLAKWGAGTVGSALASSGLPALGGLAGGLVGAATPIPGGAAIGSSLGASAGSYNMEANEAAANAFMDEKIRAESEPDKVIKAMRLKGAANAALEGLMAPTALLGSRVFGNTAKEAIRPGLVGGIQHAGREALKTGIDEAATEAAQEQVGQVAQNYLNPERDKTGDAWQTLNAAAQGLIGGVAIGAPGTLAEVHRAQKPRNTDEATLTEPAAPPPGLTDAQLLAWDDKRQQDRHDAAYRLARSGSIPELADASDAFMQNRDPEAFAAALQQHVGARHELEDVDLFTRQATGPKSKNSETGEDATHDPEDLLAMRNLFANLAPNSALANDPERATEVYYALKNMMVNDPTADVPLERIAKSFGGEQFLHKALSGMRGDLVRMGELQHDETASETMKSAIGRRVTSAKQAAEVFGRYLTLKAKDTLEQEHGPITQRDAGVTAAELAHRLNNYGQLSQRERDEFEKTTSFLFGSNKETAITSMGGRKHYKGKSKFDTQREEARMDNAREETDATFDEGDHESQSIFDVEGSKTHFVGRTGAEDGQFFNTHYNKPEVREQARSKMADITAKNRALGHNVEELTPGQYVRASGTPARTVAAQLGVETEGRSTGKIMADLDNHAARILKVTEGVLDEDSVKLSTEDIIRLAEKEKEAQRRFGTKVVDAPTAAAISEALAASRQTGGFKEAHAKLVALGVPNATEVVQARGKHIVKQNFAHGGEGRFVVTMKDGTEHTLSAQDMINDSYARLGSEPKQKAQPGRAGTMGRQFAMSISSIMNNPDVKDVHVVDRFGKKHTPESVAKMVKKTITDKEGNTRELTDKQHAAKVKAMRREYGRFGPFFKIGVKDGKPVTLAQAARSLASKRGEEVSDNFSKMLEELGTTDETGRIEMINHLMNIVSNEAEAEALEQVLTDEEATLTPVEKKRLEKLRKRKRLNRDERDELSDLEDTELLGEQTKISEGKAAAVSGEGRTPDTHMVEEGRQEETGVRKFNELTGDKVGSALKGSRKVEAAPEGVLTLSLKNEVTQEDVPKVLNLLTKAVRDTAQLLPKEMTQAMQDIYNLLGRAIDQKQTGTEAVQRSLRKNVKEQSLGILRTELKFINDGIKATTEPALRADGMKRRAAIIALAEKINKLIPAVEAETKSQNAEADVAMAVIREGEAATTYEQALVALNRLNKLIAANDGTVAQMKRLNTKQGELAAKVTSLKPGAEVTPVTQSMRDKAAALRAQYHKPGEGPMQREEVTLEDMDAVRAYIKKTLGPKVKVAFDAALKSTGNWNKTGNDTLISIATRAANPMSTARHEAMHEFFDRLSDADPAMAAVLAKAANSAPVVRQLEQIFNSMPKVLKALKTDEHERVAYMFEAWSAGLLTVGPATESVFQRIVKMLKAVFGVLNEDAQAERIMELFHEGSLRKPSAIAEVLANDPEMQAAYSTKVLTALDPVIRYAKYLLGTAHGQTASSNNPFVSWAGKEMYVGTGEKTNNLGLFAERAQKTNQMQDEVNLIFKDLDDKDMKILVDGLQSRKFSADPKILRAQKRVDRFLQKMLDYANREDPVYGWKGLDIKKAKDYFPRAWDSETIGNNRDQFVADLLKHHGDILERIASGGHQTYEAGKLKVAKTTPEEVAERIAQVLIYGRGATPNEEHLWELGYAPFMAARNARSLDWLDQKHFSQYMQKDAVNILTTYVNQMVHTVEYSKRFGLNGEKLQTALNDAAYWELEQHPDKKVVKAFAEARKELDGKWVIAQAKAVENAQKGGTYFTPVPKPKLDDYIDAADKLIGGNTVAKFINTKIGLTRKQIMAMEGTLGFDISERMRKIQGNLIVYENLRTLPMALFSNLIDPLGVMVHGGSLDDALNTFRLGLEGVINGWRGKDSDNPAYALARKYGTIDATKMLNSMGQVYSSVWTDRTARRINDALFRANGVEGNAQGNRAGATVAAVHKIEASLTSKSPHDLRLMQELYGEEYKPADVVLTAEGELDPVDRRNQKAVFKLVDRMMLRPNAAMRPGWASDPHLAIFFHLKQFMFAFQKVMLEHVAKEAKHGNYDPVLVMAAGYVPLMIAADMLKDLAMYGGEPPWKKKWKAGDYLQNGVQRAGLLGVPQMALDVKQWGPAELGGPAVEQVANAAKTYEKALKKDRRLDVKAAKTHKASDLQKAEDFSGVADATRKTVRAALPLNQLFKRHLYDKYEPKVEQVVKEHLKTGSLQE